MASRATRPTRPSSGAQHGEVDGFALQAFGGVQLERAVDAQHVDGAHLRHHVGGDQDDDLVEALLRADRLRHDLAEPAQQHARTAKRATHGVRSSGSSRRTLGKVLGNDRAVNRGARIPVGL